MTKMNRARGILSAAAFAAFLGSRAAVAQTRDTTAVVAPAIARVRTELPPGRLVRVFSDADRRARIRCTSRRPDTCAITGSDMVMLVPAPRMFGDSAEVVVSVWLETGVARSPVQRRTYRYWVKRSGSAWVISRLGDQSST